MQLTMMSAIVRRNLLAVRPSMTRAISVSAPMLKENDSSSVPVAHDESQRDLIGEQVNRIGEPAAMSLVSGAPSTCRAWANLPLQSRCTSVLCVCTRRPRRRRRRAVPTRTTGAWTLTCCRTRTAGRTRS